MLIGASRFGSVGLSSPASVGEDPRRFLEAAFPAGGVLAAKLSIEYAIFASLDLGGELDAPFIRRKRTGVQMRGLFSQGSDLAVSPVQVTLDGSGRLAIVVHYEPGRLRSILGAGGELEVSANAHMRTRIKAQAEGGFFARLSEYQKIRVRLEGGGELAPGVSRKQYLTGTFRAEGGVRISPWYELIGEVDDVIANRVFVVVTHVPRLKVVCVSAAEPEDITVIEVGI